MASETLKEYLVKLGWNVDKSGFDNASSLVDKFSAKLISRAGKMGTAFISTSASMVKASLATVDAISDIAFSVAEADTSVERLARKYWLSEQSARSLKNAQDQLGISVEDLMYATDEEYKRFLELNTYGKSLEAPKALDDTLVKIRDIQFEFSKLGTILEYGKRWFMYYLGEYLGLDIDQTIVKFKSFNDWLRTNLPKITQKLAKIVALGWRFAKTVLTLIYNLAKGLVQIVERLGTSGVATILALAAALKLVVMGPLGLVIAGLTAVVLLLDDFFAWRQGRNSLLDWTKVSGTFDDLQQSFSGVVGSVETLFDALGALFGEFEVGNAVLSIFKAGLMGIQVLLDGLSAGIMSIVALFNSQMTNLQREAERTVANFWKTIGSLFGETVDERGVTTNGVFGKMGDMIYPYVGGHNPTGVWHGGAAPGSPAYKVKNQGSTVYNNNTNIGSVNTNVNKSNASAKDISKATVDRIKDMRHSSNVNSRMTRL